MSRPIVLALFVSGLLIALLGIGVDHLLPGASPGVNLPQLIVVCLGLSLSWFARLLRRERFRRRFIVSLNRNIVTASVITLITLLALEILLAVSGMPTYFPQELPETDFQVISWTLCDEDGCRLNYEAKYCRMCRRRVIRQILPCESSRLSKRE